MQVLRRSLQYQQAQIQVQVHPLEEAVAAEVEEMKKVDEETKKGRIKEALRVEAEGLHPLFHLNRCFSEL